jgi:hypothetical protein
MITSPSKLILDESNFLRLDGSACCRLIVEDGVIWLEFLDRDRLRSQCRGDQRLRIKLDDFKAQVEALIKSKEPKCE